jgi:uncharacterized integral membrane protein
MHRIWVGLDPQIIMSVLGSFIAGTVLVIHLFAFRVVNYPGSTMAKYATPAAATR